MRHRGAEGADNKTGDGAGIMLQIPHEFILLQGIPVPKRKIRHRTSIPAQRRKRASRILSIMIEEIEREGLTLMHLRNVPTQSVNAWEKTHRPPNRTSNRYSSPESTDAENLERTLYIIRKKIEKRVRHKDFYIVSLSGKNIIYKGMLSSMQVREYFPDLTNHTLPADWHWCTPVSAPTHSLHGVWHSLSVCWRTTVKSIPSAATEDGWKHAKVSSPLRHWGISKPSAPLFSQV